MVLGWPASIGSVAGANPSLFLRFFHLRRYREPRVKQKTSGAVVHAPLLNS